MSQKLRRLLIGTVFFPALLSAGCAVRRAKPALPSNPRTASGRDFLVRIVNDSAAAQAVAHACWGKNVPQELRSLCTEMITVRGLEGEIATRYLRLWFGTEAPAADQSPVPPLVISENGPKFALAFLELMIQRDKDEIADVEACMAQAIRPELTAFCQMLQRARTVEIRLLQNQLCRLREDCRLHGDRDEQRLGLNCKRRNICTGSPPRSERQFLHLNVASPLLKVRPFTFLCHAHLRG